MVASALFALQMASPLSWTACHLTGLWWLLLQQIFQNPVQDGVQPVGDTVSAFSELVSNSENLLNPDL
jgi:hypothetical protein